MSRWPALPWCWLRQVACCCLRRRLFSRRAWAPKGSGRQYMSWISLEDEVWALLFATSNLFSLSGPVNRTGRPVTKAEFTHRVRRRGQPPDAADGAGLRSAGWRSGFAQEGSVHRVARHPVGS